MTSIGRGSISIISQDHEILRWNDKVTKQKIIKNVAVIGLGFVFLFTSFNSMSYLQSSINPEIGTNSLSVVYGFVLLSCFFLPCWIIDKLKEKKTIGFGMCGYLMFIAAQFYPKYYTLYPAAIVVGLSGAPMWSATNSYLTQVAIKYALIVKENKEVILTRFFGIFFFFFQSAHVWGHVISSTVLSTEPTIVLANDTARLSQCGSNFCPNSITDGSVALSREVTMTQRLVMSCIYIFCAAMASTIIFLFLDPLSKFKEEDEETNKSGKDLMAATIIHMFHPYQLLIIPLNIFSGAEQAFLGADFTSAYVGCGLGVYMVGYVLICYGVCDAISSTICSSLVKYFGRVPVFTLGALINASLIAVLMTWSPTPDQRIVFFIIAGLWGFVDAIWQTQITSLYGVLFPNAPEAAFSNYGIWDSTGFMIGFYCSGTLCTDVKIYFLIIALSLGMVGYYSIEFLEKKKVLPRDKEDNVVVTMFDLIWQRKLDNCDEKHPEKF